MQDKASLKASEAAKALELMLNIILQQLLSAATAAVLSCDS
jgi:hypothetical protein